MFDFMLFAKSHIGLVLIIAFPLIGFVINGLFGSRFSRWMVNFVGVFFPLLSFILVLGVFGAYYIASNLVDQTGGDVSSIFPLHYTTAWVSLSSEHHPLNIDFGFYIDSLSLVMMLIITGIGFLIHLFSIGYMKPENGVYKFFAYMNLFLAAMLILVMADNLIFLFLGWEGVGLCSYLLIAFFYHKEDFAAAGKKAFIFNRVGDAGFLLGIILIFFAFGTITISGGDQSVAGIISHLEHSVAGDSDISLAIDHENFSDLGFGLIPLITLITLLLFLGATGKSAQLPLYTWLPDAMAGPTPVSALIHAATMVTAGVYMVARLWFLFNFTLAPATMIVILLIAAITSLMAGVIGLAQNDIKKVLAYSTVSQLGFMFMAMGAGAYSLGMFHVTTHAFFKALLFLSAGSVILSLHHIYGEDKRQDIRYMGGLRKILPITFVCFFIGALSLSGIPFFSGFFSKDAILESVFFIPGIGPFIWVLAILSAILTAAYTWR